MTTEARSSALAGGVAICRGAPAPVEERGTFTVHGHRLSSLYRPPMKRDNPFIFLKILTAQALPRAQRIEYLGKDEARWATCAAGAV